MRSLVLAVSLALPFALAAGVRSSRVRAWAETTMAALARRENVTGAWKVDVSFLPRAAG